MSCVHTHAYMCLEQGGLGGWDGDVTIWAACWGGGGGRGSQLQPAVWKPSGDAGCLPQQLAGDLGTRPLLNLCPPRARPPPQGPAPSIYTATWPHPGMPAGPGRPTQRRGLTCMLLQGAGAQSGDRRAGLRGTGVPSALGGARQMYLGSEGLGRGLCASAGSWGTVGCRLPAWNMAPPASDMQAQEGQTARVQGRPVYSEGAHALWLVGQTAMSVGGSGSGQREGRWGFLQGGSWQGPSPEPEILPGGCPAGMRGLSRGALLRGTGPPSSDRPPQERAEGSSHGPCPEACEPPALSLGLPLGMAAAERVGGNGVQRKVCFIASI